jgi:hypothetical protein
VLGLPYQASILLPFSFLVIGARFWPELATARRRYYLFYCGVAAVVLDYAWLREGPGLAAGLPHPAWVGIVALVVSMVWRVAPETILCGLAGFFICTALGVGPSYVGVEAHGFRDQYRALWRARERVETVRQGGPVRFWCDKQDRFFSDALALACTYSWDTLLSQSFSTVPCGQDLAPSTIIATVGSDPAHGPDFVASTLTDCWSGKGLRVVPVETDTIPRGAASYRLALLRVERAPPAP